MRSLARLALENVLLASLLAASRGVFSRENRAKRELLLRMKARDRETTSQTGTHTEHTNGTCIRREGEGKCKETNADNPSSRCHSTRILVITPSDDGWLASSVLLIHSSAACFVRESVGDPDGQEARSNVLRWSLEMGKPCY